MTGTAPSKITQNAVGLFLLQFVVKGMSAVWTFYLARRLGVELYGLWANILALVSIFGVLQGFGILSIVVKDVSQDVSRARNYFGASILAYGAAALLAFLFTLASGWALGYDAHKMGLVALAAFTFLFFAPGLACQSVMYGHEEFLLYTFISNLGTLVYMALGIAAVELGYGVPGVFAALGLGYAATSVILFWVTIPRYGSPVMAGASQLGLHLARLGLPLVLSVILTEVMLRADRILIDRYLGEAAVGYYHAAFNVVYLPREIFFVPLVTAVFTRIFSSYAQDRAAFDNLFEKIHIGLFLLTLPISSFCMIFPNQIIHVFYGPGFGETARILPVLVWMLPPLFIFTVWQNIFIIQNRTRMIFWINLAGMCFNLAFNFLFIRRWGILASAAAAVATQFLMLGAAFWLLKSENIFHFSRRIPNLLLSFAVATGLIWFMRPAGDVSRPALLGLLAAGSAVYALIFFLFGAMNREEIALMKRQILALRMPLKNALQAMQGAIRIE